MASGTPQLIEGAVHRFQEEVPALARLKLVFALELRGRGDVQIFRVELPGPKVTKGVPDDARVKVSMPRSHFNELATDGGVRHYREAFEQGHIKVEGDANVQKLIAQVVARHEQRSRLRKVR
jgi:SCP-2 sterol transfer family